MSNSEGQPGQDAYELSADKSRAAAGASCASLLQVGSVYIGTISAHTDRGSYGVTLDNAHELHDVTSGVGIFTGLLGFKTTHVLPPGTRVAVAYGGGMSFILSAAPCDLPDKENGGNRTMIWGDFDEPQYSGYGKVSEMGIPEDMLEGEFDLENAFGVGVRFLTTIACMRAGDRAKVETHMLNEMVRIISTRFSHISGLGEENIYEQGRGWMERGWTNYRHELFNKMSEGEPLASMSGDEVDKDSIKRIKDVGRYRLLEYIGHVGDFMHSFLCDPPESIADLMDAERNKRAGKSWIHHNLDGSIIMQSVADIVLERVVRNPLPVRGKHPEDPEVTKQRKFKSMSQDWLKPWGFGKTPGEGEKDAYRTTYQLREYARWLSRFHAVARLGQMADQTEEFKMFTESDSPEPEWTCKEKDKEGAASKDKKVIEAYSTIRIMRDGSIVCHDGYGSTVTMSNGNIQISAARHLDLEAAGDIRIVAGQSLFIRAKRHIEIVASAGGIVMRSFAFFKALCEKGGLWLRSDAKRDDLEPKEEKDPKPEMFGDKAILIETTRDDMATRSAGQMLFQTDKTPDDAAEGSSEGGDGHLEDKTKDIVFASKTNIRMLSDWNTIVHAKENALFGATRNVVQNGRALYGQFNEIDYNNGGIYFRPSSGRFQARTVEILGTLSSVGSIFGPRIEGQVIPHVMPSVPYKPHLNHIQELKDQIFPDMGSDEEGIKGLKFGAGKAAEPVTSWVSMEQGPKWEHFPKKEYYWDDCEEQPGALVETLTQQYIRKDDPKHWGEDKYDDWSWTGDTLRIDVRVGQNKKSYGIEAKQFQHDSGDNLHKKSSKDAKEFGTIIRTWEAKDEITFKKLKRPE